MSCLLLFPFSSFTPFLFSFQLPPSAFFMTWSGEETDGSIHFYLGPEWRWRLKKGHVDDDETRRDQTR